MKGATIECLLARAIDQRPIEGARGLAISTLRRFLACGYSRKARTNLTPSGRGLTEAELEFIGTEAFVAEEEDGHTLGPNHVGDHTNATWRYSGEGYNRVRLCSCGAEDHAADVS